MTVSSMRSQVEGSTSESSEDLVARRANNAYRISLITAIVMAVLTIVAVVVAEADYYEAIETAFVTVIALISAWLSRRKRQNLGVMMLIVSLFITEFAFTLVTQNQAIPVALLLGLIAWYLAYSALPPKWVRWIVLSSVLVGLLAILLDLFGPNRPTGMPGVAIPLSLGAIIIYSFLIIRQFRSYSLRTKLILGFLVVALIPLALLAVINIVNQRNRELTSVNQTLYQVASETALLFDEFIDNELNDIRVFGQCTISFDLPQ
jgi:hypothetical protein